ncbi:MAG TPA: YhjD/YihY/BrkB family envelope integrity protein, partial [Ktedonobacteraceae bacterium]|nr:YhjD/YihY/BrkB family envelope integrity protein [Ktedonobacteraceae bacterium]
MTIGLRGAREVIVSVYKEVQRTRVFNIAAGLSYYFLLSLFPLLILLATLLGYLPIPHLFDHALDFASRFVPQEAMGLVRKILGSVLTPNRGGLLSIGIIGTIWAASSGFASMIDALNIAYDARQSRTMLKQRLRAIELMFITGGLMALDGADAGWKSRWPFPRESLSPLIRLRGELALSALGSDWGMHRALTGASVLPGS